MKNTTKTSQEKLPRTPSGAKSVTSLRHAELRRAFDKKVRAGLFKNVGHRLPPWVREDRLQDALCRTWKAYVRYADQGKVLNDHQLAQLHYWKVIDRRHRSFAATTAMPKYDVMNERNADRFAFTPVDSSEGEDDDWHATKVKTEAALASDVTDDLAECVDLRTWLSGLTPRERRLVELRVAGHTIAEITRKTRTDSRYVSAALEVLGYEVLNRAAA